MKFARNRYRGGMSSGSLASSGCRVSAIISAIIVATPNKQPIQTRGNGGSALDSDCCSCDSPPDQSIPPSMNLTWERNGPAAARSNHLGNYRVPLSPRVASPCVAYINWQGSYCGGRDDLSHETRLADCPGRSHI